VMLVGGDGEHGPARHSGGNSGGAAHTAPASHK
jgi:hypothetical protein